MQKRSYRLFLAATVALCATAPRASAQVNIRPRVLIMVDTSGSMTEHFQDNNTTGGDGSILYTDGVMTRGLTQTPGYGMFPGTMLVGACNAPPTVLTSYDGINSRLYAAKGALANIVNGAGGIDWGLMRYTGTVCATPNTFTRTAGNCTGFNDAACGIGEFCVGGRCGTDDNLCNNYQFYDQACNVNGQSQLTFGGTCGTGVAANNALCTTPQVCYADADCAGAKAGQCAIIAGGSASSCQCGGAFAACPAGYACTAGRCAYSKACQNPGGVILVDPTSNNPNSAILPYVDGIEALPGNLLGLAVNPELRAVGGTPLAGAARSATTWYNNIKNGNLDAKIACRPYVLVQMTDGFDSCDNDNTMGPVAAVQGFVGATVAAAKNINKVYVVGLAFGNNPSPALDSMAAAGGTGKARLANSQADIQAALADIVQSSVLVEKCNNADDDCNGQCDESFPDVLVNGNGCSNPHAAKACNNGALQGTKCYATGVFQCSMDGLSEVCSAGSCAQGTAPCPVAEAIGKCNQTDDDCNGVIDDCTPYVANSCCNACPACNLTGVPQPETCNGCDDDCDTIVDNHLTDTGSSCGLSIGMCEPGTTYCCQEANPAIGSCTQSQVSGNKTDKLVCLGGRGPAAEVCDGVDNDCNGVTDEVSQGCYPFGSGTPGVGICRSGTQQCNAMACGTAPNACCANLSPPISNGKSCAGNSSYAACSGAVGPAAETCNGIDDDCNGVIDNNLTDVWVNTACCPSGNLADCNNSGGSNRCKQGAYVCVAGARACSGAVAKVSETCNGVDDDCNGTADDVAGVGGQCAGNGLSNVGTCKAAYACVGGAPGPGPSGLTCTQLVGPMPEVCNGLDDNCNGSVDDNPTDVGMACGSLCPGGQVANCVGACKAGAFVCANGVKSCAGNVGPSTEVCDGIDNDCNAKVDDNVSDAWVGQACCATGNLADCTNAGGSNQCKQGAYACVGGARACSASVAKGVETCNNVDDDCNGKVDDVAGVGTSCTGNGINTKGTCTAVWTCAANPGPGPNGLTCQQVKGPMPETCNGLDDDCDGIVDNNLTDVGMTCADLCPGMQLGNCVGQCKAGKVACVNGAKLCNGAVGPSPEVCDGLDNDCNGATDDKITDAWVNSPCCPTGNVADCTNSGGSMSCAVGSSQCVAGARACSGAIAKSTETCNGKDDDCNGKVDDIGAIGMACSGNGVNTNGVCTAQWTCTGQPGPGPQGLTCKQAVGPMPETCNGLDDDCNNVVDDNPVDVGVPCGDKCPGGNVMNCVGACKAGVTSCSAGMKKCGGSVGPSLETCNGVDDDCNNVIDDVPGAGQACTGMGILTQGACAASYACVNKMPGPGPNGLTCVQTKGKMAETCNGIDDDCNGLVDDNPIDVGGACGDACPGGNIMNCVGACKPGTYVCSNGAKLCSGAIGPSPEVCNGIDDDCNKAIDDGLKDAWLGMACCPTGNLGDCTNSGGSMQCRPGTFACMMGGRACVGGVARANETCNGVDDNCNGVVDDVPGIGLACNDKNVRTQGPCTAAYACNGMAGPGPNGLTCTQKIGPGVELCNNIDDDCNGVIDDNLVDPRIGVVGGQPCVPLPQNQMSPPCNAGMTACAAGAIVCAGEVFPQPNICGRAPTDCSGNAMGGDCPKGLVCQDGMCVPPCGVGEFPCPGGYMCDSKTNNCIPDPCAKLKCDPGFQCLIDDMGVAHCIDRCKDVKCDTGTKCVNGACVDDTCRTNGCPMGQVCVGQTPTAHCDADPCHGVVCPDGKFCNIKGTCISPCPPCAPGQLCSNGQCVDNPCLHRECNLGEICSVINNTPTCIPNQCKQGCGTGLACCQGMCLTDPCTHFTCPGDATCEADDYCNATCTPRVRDKIVAAGGGGASLGCTVGAGHAGGSSPWSLALVGLGLALFLRRRWLRLPTVGAVVLLAASLTGCNPNPFCLNCGDNGDGGHDMIGTGTDDAGPDDTMDLSSTDGPCVTTHNGVEICDGLDNDCNGKIDDVQPAGLAHDPNNCGGCGIVCDYASIHMYGDCVGAVLTDGGWGTTDAGTPAIPACAPSVCQQGWVDANHDLKDGCELQCTPSNGGVEVCDGKDNDCNGIVDDQFGHDDGMGHLLYDSDVMNCGTCGNICNLPGAVSMCVPDANTKQGICVVDHCINDGMNTYRHQGYMQGVPNRTGCEYHCAVASKTMTGAHQDCDNSQCAFDAEVCNSLDDDCNFLVDDSPKDVGGPCGGDCPGGDVNKCVGECKAGIYKCNAGVRSCQGSVGPQPETCDNKDNDCSGKADDNLTDAWINQACCPSGSLADCANTSTGNMMGTRCMQGALACVAGNRACVGAVMKGPESCNNVDDNCNGVIDDVPGVGTSCAGNGVNTVGACSGAFVCNPKMPGMGPGGLTCAQNVAPTAEVCNGIDDDCNGVIDNNPKDVGAACGAACPGGDPKNCIGQCKTGITSCVNGSPVCNNSVGPTLEVCDGIDNDCNGVIDDVAAIGSACAGNGIFTQGACTAKYICNGKMGPGPGGLTCQQVIGPKIETCNGVDDDCNGTPDDNLTDTGGACATLCPGGLLANCKGLCKAGVQTCVAGALVCQGGVGPTIEVCNGKDEDCDGVVDDNLTDAWVGQGCCPTGNNGDCTNTGNGNRCSLGVYQCTNAAKVCMGGVAKAAETCDGIDNDCNGKVDDVPGVGLACTGGGTNTTGVCTASYVCNGNPGPGPNGLTCKQVVGPTNELCNGLDDNCNGAVDDAPTDVGAACGSNCPGGLVGNCVGACKAGTTVCTNGARVCSGSLGPSIEVCNGIDDDCNGSTDDKLTDAWINTACCPTGNLSDCGNTGNGVRCAAGTFQCTAGARACMGGVAKSAETCNNVDDDCNGAVDDIAAIGARCTGGGTNTQGACTATYVCKGTPGPGPSGLTCTQLIAPQPETCNGVDDDCNNVVDDNLTDTGAACSQNCPGGLLANCVGQCKAGTITCSGGVKACTGSTGPSAEVCDGADNDCNGTIDDGFGYPLYNTDPKNCGKCGTSCGLANAINGCHTDANIDNSNKGVCYVISCNNGNNNGFAYVPVVGSCGGAAPPRDGPAGIGCNYACPVWPTTAESCDGKDNNCNGVVDEFKSGCAPDGLVKPGNFCATKGVCTGLTIPIVCGGALGWKCDYSGVANVEVDVNGNLLVNEKVCDGKDGNCNGSVDLDGFPTLGQVCNVGVGVCGAQGTVVCKTPQASGCSATVTPSNAVDEVCNGLDDNCDGQVDERTPTGNPLCYNGGQHNCKGWVDQMVAVPKGGGGTVYVYSYEASRPGATSMAAGTNGSRSCSVGNVMPWAFVTETQAAAACAAIKDSMGAAMHLCTAAEWVGACEGPGGAAASKWSLSKVPGTYVAQICNDVNQAPMSPAAWATGSNGAQSIALTEFCYSDWVGAGKVYDMSGNLSEWTSSTVVTGGVTYYQLQGGSYTSPQGGVSCEFNFDIARPGFANSDVGFRCCADNAP